MKRGFKAKAEKISEEARAALGIEATARLDPWDYAALLKVDAVGADSLDLPQEHARQLLERDAASWSGLTLGHNGQTLIVLNSAHTQVRQCSTLMHELAHLRLNHVPASVQVSQTRLLLLSDYSDDQEEEADWLMGALLLPRSALFLHRSRGKTLDEIAKRYRVSDDLCRWRLRMTGVETQLRHMR